MIRQVETWKAFIVENQTYYQANDFRKFNLVVLTPEERGWTELFQYYPPIDKDGGSSTSPIDARTYSWTYGFLPIGYLGATNNSQVFTSTGTWQCPEGITEIYVRCIGKGANAIRASGGGGGGFILVKIKVVPLNTYNIRIDAAASSFNSVVSALAGNGSNGGSYTYSGDGIEFIFGGEGGNGGNGGGGGGSELGKGGNSGNFGGGGLHGNTNAYGGGGMMGAGDSGGGGFMSASGGSSNGKGMFSANIGLKFNTSPYYNLISEEITPLVNWGQPDTFGGGTTSGSYAPMFSGGRYSDTAYGGFGGGGGGNTNKSKNGGRGGYGGGGGGSSLSDNWAIGGFGGSGGGGGFANGASYRASGGNGGYGGGGGGASANSGTRVDAGTGGNGLVILEW